MLVYDEYGQNYGLLQCAGLTGAFEPYQLWESHTVGFYVDFQGIRIGPIVSSNKSYIIAS